MLRCDWVMAADAVTVGCRGTFCIGRYTKCPVSNFPIQSLQYISTKPQLGKLRVSYDLFLVALIVMFNLVETWTTRR
jgi:hypothetical protein